MKEGKGSRSHAFTHVMTFDLALVSMRSLEEEDEMLLKVKVLQLFLRSSGPAPARRF